MLWIIYYIIILFILFQIMQQKNNEISLLAKQMETQLTSLGDSQKLT